MRCVCVRKRARVRITIGSSLFCIRFRSECTTVPNTLRKKRIKGVLCFCFLFYYYFQFFFLVHVRSFKTAVPSSVPCADERDERNCCMWVYVPVHKYFCIYIALPFSVDTTFSFSRPIVHTHHTVTLDVCLQPKQQPQSNKTIFFFLLLQKRNDPTTLTTFYLLSFHLCIFTFSIHWNSCFSYYFPPSYFFSNCIPTPISMEPIRCVSPTPHRNSFRWWLRFGFETRHFIHAVFFFFFSFSLRLIPFPNGNFCHRIYCHCSAGAFHTLVCFVANAKCSSWVGFHFMPRSIANFFRKKVEEIRKLMGGSSRLGDGKVHKREHHRRDDITLTTFTKNSRTSFPGKFTVMFSLARTSLPTAALRLIAF